MIKSFLFLLICSLFFLGQANAQVKSKAIVYTDPAKTIQVTSKNPNIVLTLKSNATTGYAWFLLGVKERFIQPVSHRFVAPQSNLMGAPGYEVWTFKVKPSAFKVPRAAKITMIYARPWEIQDGDKTRFYVALESN